MRQLFMQTEPDLLKEFNVKLLNEDKKKTSWFNEKITELKFKKITVSPVKVGNGKVLIINLQDESWKFLNELKAEFGGQFYIRDIINGLIMAKNNDEI